MLGIGVIAPPAGSLARWDQMAKMIEVREGDRILVWLDVTRVAEDALDQQVVTVDMPGQKVTALLKSFDIVKHEKGHNWPG